ncbi:MAG TPA: paraquat-inducible protein A, partial [Steroidobacteraceae bacterium]|nr:paraquat-inducible protein A [Steroidobacteraceae bacterium]
AAVCPSCEHRLERTTGRSTIAALLFALTTFILLFPANIEPLMKISVLGVDRETRIGSGISTLWDGQWVLLAMLIALFAVVLPFVRFGLLSFVLACVQSSRQPPWLSRLYRLSLQLDIWAMPDVLLLGAAVGYSRIEARVPVDVGAGGICLILAAISAMLCRATLDRRSVWRSFECRAAPQPGAPTISCTVCDLAVSAHRENGRCPRCFATLHSRKPFSTMRTLALTLAGLSLYIPANLYPMNTNVQLGQDVPYRIIDGVKDLFQAGLWPLGVLIFCTSIAIPLLKLAGLIWFLIAIRRRSRRALVFRTKLYRLIDEIGRWSNVDVFTIAIFVPMIQFGGLATASAGPGAIAFMLVVTLTMIASRMFDPRLMWDAALAGATA